MGKLDDAKIHITNDKIIEMKRLVGRILTTVLQEEAISSMLYKARKLAQEVDKELEDLWKESIK